MALREGRAGLGHVVVRVLSGQARLSDDVADQLLRPIVMDEAWFPYAQHLGHLGWLEVLVSTLRVMRPEELSQLLPRVIYKIADRPQAGKHYQVTAVKGLPKLIVVGQIRVDVDGH